MDHDIRQRVDQLAELIEEFRLDEAKLKGDDWEVAFKKRREPVAVVQSTEGGALPAHEDDPLETADAPAPEPAEPTGSPVTSPMNGIYYSAPSPSAPPFVREGEHVNAGQVVGLIEAMKVFNEIVAPMAGTVTKIAAKNGEVVNPGQPLLFIG